MEGGGREVVQMTPLVRVERAQRQRELPYRCADAHDRDLVPQERAKAQVLLRQRPGQLGPSPGTELPGQVCCDVGGALSLLPLPPGLPQEAAQQGFRTALIQSYAWDLLAQTLLVVRRGGASIQAPCGPETRFPPGLRGRLSQLHSVHRQSPPAARAL